MSMESAKAFMERMNTDEDFRNKVNECKDQEARKAFVKQAGFNFTKDDLDLAKVELNEGDLSSVVGGLDNGWQRCNWVCNIDII